VTDSPLISVTLIGIVANDSAMLLAIEFIEPASDSIRACIPVACLFLNPFGAAVANETAPSKLTREFTFTIFNEFKLLEL
jgi:hypothetical protein